MQLSLRSWLSLVLLTAVVGCGSSTLSPKSETEAQGLTENTSRVKGNSVDASEVVAGTSTVQSGSIDEEPAFPKTIQINLKILGVQGNKGSCRIAIYDSPKAFNKPEMALHKESVPLDGRSESSDDAVPWDATINIPNGMGVYIAIAVYHDQNGNDQLDKNSLGIPIEPYGFSMNPKRGFGPPKFQEVSFVFSPDTPFDMTVKLE